MSLGLQPYINQIFLGEFVHLEGQLLLVNKQDTVLFSTFLVIHKSLLIFFLVWEDFSLYLLILSVSSLLFFYGPHCINY